MKSLRALLEERFLSLFEKLFPHLDLAPFLPPEIFQTVREEFGNYQCNSPLKLSSVAKKSPRAVAENLIAKWREEGKDELIEKMEAAGPGFINVWIAPKALAKQLTHSVKDPKLGSFLQAKKKRIVVEFSGPNVAKELHVGHLRSTIIGDSLARLFEFLGYDVLRLNHIGDFGTAFGMLIHYLCEKKPDAFKKDKNPSLAELMEWYREAKQLFDTDAQFKKCAQQEVVNLQAKEPKAVALWEKICAISRKGFHEIYRLLDIKVLDRGESFYAPMLADLVADCEAKGLVTVSGGAKCIFLDGFFGKDKRPLPMILQKSDGGYNYETTDLAALFHRVHTEKALRILYVVDAGQKLHFQMVFAAAKKAGYYDPKEVDVEHVPFGVVLGPDGKKFKTRSGKTERLVDLLQAAVNEARRMLKMRLEDASEEEIEELAQTLGINAVKYADLSCHRVKDYAFSYEKMLRFEGNTAPYLLYSYVRIQSIKKKVGKCIDALVATTPLTLQHPAEISLGMCLRQFGEALESMSESLLPNRLADYLYILAQKFHAFFRDCRVEGSSEESSRLLLCELTGRILEKGLALLGLKTLPRM